MTFGGYGVRVLNNFSKDCPEGRRREPQLEVWLGSNPTPACGLRRRRRAVYVERTRPRAPPGAKLQGTGGSDGERSLAKSVHGGKLRRGMPGLHSKSSVPGS